MLPLFFLFYLYSKMPVQIEKLIYETVDPMLQKSIKTLGLTLQISKTQDHYELELLAGFPINEFKKTLIPLLESTLLKAYPTLTFTINMQTWIKAHQTQLLGLALRGVKNTIAIASGKGGVGKSTVAVNLATALAKSGAKVGILDADIYGPSIPIMLGKHLPPEVSNNRYLPIQAHGLQAMSIGYLIEEDKALIWRGPMLAKSLIQMLDLTQWDELDYLFIDLPPGTGDIQLSLVQKIPLTAAVVVTTPQEVALIDAQKAIKMFHSTNIDVLGIIENMATHVCNHCGHEASLFGAGGGEKLAEQFNIPLLGQLPFNAEIRTLCDEGKPIASFDNELSQLFTRTALNLSIELAKKPLNYSSKFPPITVME